MDYAQGFEWLNTNVIWTCNGPPGRGQGIKCVILINCNSNMQTKQTDRGKGDRDRQNQKSLRKKNSSVCTSHSTLSPIIQAKRIYRTGQNPNIISDIHTETHTHTQTHALKSLNKIKIKQNMTCKRENKRKY